MQKRAWYIDESLKLVLHMVGVQNVPYLNPYPSEANFILCDVTASIGAHGVKLALEKQGILVRYYNKPGLADCIRISVGRPEQTDRLLQALHALEI